MTRARRAFEQAKTRLERAMNEALPMQPARARTSRAAIAIAVMAVGAASAACSIPLQAANEVLANRCESDDDCAGAGVCATVAGERTCVAITADLAGLLVEVGPPSGEGFVAGSSYLFPLADAHPFEGTAASGHVRSFDPALTTAVRIQAGRVLLKPSIETFCPAEDGSIPAEVELRRSTKFVGLPPATYVASSAPSTSTGPSSVAKPGYVFHLELPPDEYDIYVKPVPLPAPPAHCTVPEGSDAPPPACCAMELLPPFLRRAQIIDDDVSFTLELPDPDRLAGTLVPPEGYALDGWLLEMADPYTGRVISTTHTFASGAPLAFELRYYWFEEKDSPILRLRPPEGTAAPTVYWKLDVVDLDGDRKVELTLTDLQTAPVAIEGQVVDGETAAPLVASVTIQSIELSGGVAKNGTYTVYTQTDASGAFQANLVPGRYRIVAQPTPTSDRAMVVDEWEIKQGDFCCGRTLELPRKTRLQGTAVTAAGASLDGALAIASPSLPEPVAYLVDALDPAFLPREASAATDLGGQFTMGVDPGAFDLSIRPGERSGFPWVVRSRLTVQKGAEVSALGTLTVAYPAVLTGVVAASETGKPIGGARVRAWLPVVDPNENASMGALIQIGETTADPTGRYALPLPPSIAR